MMDQSKYHLLMSEIHRLMGEYSAEDFLEAAEISEDCREALLGLANYTSNPRRAKIMQEILDSGPSAAEINPSTAVNASSVDSVEEIENLLRRIDRANTTAGIQAMARTFNFKLSLSPKNGRSRNLSKLARAIANSPIKVRTQIIKDLSRESKSETQGWLDVIRGRK